MATPMLESILPTQLYDVTLDLKELIGDLGGRISSGVKTYQEKYGKMWWPARVAGLYGGPVLLSGAIKMYHWQTSNPIELGVKLVTVIGCAYMGPEFLASALTGVSFPIEKYFKERWNRQSE